MEISFRTAACERRRNQGSAEESYAGPADPVTPPITLQPKRVRRRQGSAEDKPINIESEIIENDFRTGGPRLSKLPVIFENFYSESPARRVWRSYLQAEVERILKNWNVEYEGPILQQRRWIHDRNSPADQTETIMISATKNEQDSSWFRSCVDIRQLCLSQKLSSLNVEIADRRGLIPTQSYGVEQHHPIISVWHTLEPKILSILVWNDWIAVDVLRRGINPISERNPVTVVITIEEESMFDWTDVREQLVTLLDSSGLQDVAVDIGRGRIWYGSSDEAILSEDSWKMEAKVGRSIGPGGRTEQSGTLGGFVELTFADDSTQIFGLTCFHCVVPDDLNHPSLERWQRQGVYPKDSVNDLSVEQPSLGDYEETLRFYTHELEDINTSEHVALRQKINDSDDFVAPYLKPLFEAKEARFEQLNRIKKTVEDFFSEGNLLLGSLFAASGKRRVQSSSGQGAACDWALIEVRPPRMSRNYLPELKARGYYPVGTEISNIAPPNLDGHLFKVGRTTNFTRGQYNGIGQSTIKSWKINLDGKREEVFGHEKAIVGRPIAFRDHFGTRGDSGAFVVNEYGSLVGLYWGGNEYSGVSFFTEINHVFEDIKTITGAKLVGLPRQRA